jgi:hypothetical protein
MQAAAVRELIAKITLPPTPSQRGDAEELEVSDLRFSSLRKL